MGSNNLMNKLNYIIRLVTAEQVSFLTVIARVLNFDFSIARWELWLLPKKWFQSFFRLVALFFVRMYKGAPSIEQQKLIIQDLDDMNES